MLQYSGRRPERFDVGQATILAQSGAVLDVTYDDYVWGS
jgi:hypothetical protein